MRISILVGVTLSCLTAIACSSTEATPAGGSTTPEPTPLDASEQDSATTPDAGTQGLALKEIAAGSFTMGGDLFDYERPMHKVTITRAFFIGEREITVREFRDFVTSTGAARPICPAENGKDNFTDDSKLDHPINCVSWDDAQRYATWLTSRDPNRNYRFCTEAEWEYAARAGTTTPWSCGADSACLNTHAQYDANASSFTGDGGSFGDGGFVPGATDGGDGGMTAPDANLPRTFPVKQKLPNPWGLYDMHGNAWEWTADWYGAYTAEDEVDPKGPTSGTGRQVRGGGAATGATAVRSSSRRSVGQDQRFDGIGMRLCADARVR